MFFRIWVMFWNISKIYFFIFFRIQSIKSNCCITFSQSSFSNGKFIPSQLFLFIKGLIFVILCRSFFISSWFNTIVTAYWKHVLPSLLTGFIVAVFVPNQENLYLIHHDLDLFHDIYNRVNKLNQRQTHYLSLIPNWFDVYF